MAADRNEVVAWASEVRSQRAALGEALNRSDLTLTECLEQAPNAPWASTSIGFVLESLPGARKVDTRRALGQLRVDPRRPVGGLDVGEARRIRSVFPLGSVDLGVLRPATAVMVISGPGGVGKGTITASVLAEEPALWLSRSWTTRNPRIGEDPQAYHFASLDEFDAHARAGGFLEWVEFLDYRQGSPLPDPPVGFDVLFEIDVAGAAAVRERYPEAVLVFVDAPDAATQEARLRGRGDSEERIRQRLERSTEERAAAVDLGAITLINGDLETAVAEVRRILDDARTAARVRAERSGTGA